MDNLELCKRIDEVMLNEEFNEEFERHDKRLVDVVEVLGDKASGFCAKLAIAEIDSPMYRIDEYDGFESVETTETYNWVVIK